MKKIIISLSLIALILKVGISQNIQALVKDKVFQEYKTATEKICKQKPNLELIETMLKDGKVDTKENKTIHKALGFKSFQSYKSFMDAQLKRAAYLEGKYKIYALLSEKQVADRNAEIEARLNQIIEDEDMSACKASYAACINMAHLISVAGHVACVETLDWFIVTAPLCHGAVILAFTLKKAKCIEQHSRCL